MDAPGFPLLDLPNVAMFKVLNFMTPIELWKLSNTNLWCEQLAKKVKFNITDTKAFNKYIRVDYKFKRAANYIFAPTEPSEEKWRSTVSSVAQFLGRSFAKLCLRTEDFETSWEWIHSDHRDVEILKLHIKNVEDPQKVLKTILKNGKLKKFHGVILNMEVPESFKYTDTLVFEKNMEGLIIDHSSWLSIQNIIDCNVRYFYAQLSTFRDEDLNSLLRNWLHEDVRDRHFEPMRRVKIEKADKQRINVNILLNGLQDQIRVRETDPELGKCYDFWWNDRTAVYVAVKKHVLTIGCGLREQQ